MNSIAAEVTWARWASISAGIASRRLLAAAITSLPTFCGGLTAVKKATPPPGEEPTRCGVSSPRWSMRAALSSLGPHRLVYADDHETESGDLTEGTLRRASMRHQVVRRSHCSGVIWYSTSPCYVNLPKSRLIALLRSPKWRQQVCELHELMK